MIKPSTNQCTMLPKTPNTEQETSFEALVVKWNHPFHESDVVVVTSVQGSIGYNSRLLLRSVGILADLLLNVAEYYHC